ncbi:hypothetical protein JCM11251_004261 [Rhodosporidiobolus azoricus]
MLAWLVFFLSAIISVWASHIRALTSADSPSFDPLPSAPIFLTSSSNGSTIHPLFETIVAFGDQWSDDGRGAFKLTGGEWPVDPAYFRHRFTDGLTWVEQLARGLSISSSSLAVAGATTNNTLAQGMTGPSYDTPVRSVNEQVSFFIKSTPVRPNALYLLQGGLNDFLLGQYQGLRGEEAAESLGNAMLQLVRYGARYILLLNLPSLATLPYTAHLNPFAQPTLTNFSRAFREKLYEYDRPRSAVAIVDWYALFEGFLDRPAVFGFEGGTLDEACLTGVYGECPSVYLCATPGTRIWFDQVRLLRPLLFGLATLTSHYEKFNPTNPTHFYMASLAYQVLRTQGWVELR